MDEALRELAGGAVLVQGGVIAAVGAEPPEAVPNAVIGARLRRHARPRQHQAQELLRNAAERIIEGPLENIGKLLNRFSPAEMPRLSTPQD